MELPGLVHIGGGDGVALGGDDGAEGLVLHGLHAHEGDVVGGGVVVRVVVAVGVDEVGVRHAQLGGPLVHQLHEAVHAAAHHLGQHVAGLVGRGDEGAVEHVPEGELFPFLDVLGGAAVPHVPGDLAAHGDDLVQGELPPVYGLDGQQGRHHLGDAGGVAPLMGLLLVEHGAGGGVHQDGGGGLDVHIIEELALHLLLHLHHRAGGGGLLRGLGALRCGGGGQGPGGGEGEAQAQSQKERKQAASIFFHGKLLANMI